MCQPLKKLAEEEDLTIGRGIAVRGEGKAEDEGGIGISGDGHVLDGDERANHEAGEGERELYLRNDKSSQQAPLSAAGGGAGVSL